MAGAAARFRAAAPKSEHAALDSTFFDRRRASSYFRQRAGRTIQTLKVTTLTDVESLAVLDVHIAARWKHDTKTGPQVVRRNADDLQSVAADNGFQTGTPSTDRRTRHRLPRSLSRLVSERSREKRSQPGKGYSQRWMAETSYSTTKRSLGDAVRALGWYRQFREIVLMFAITNIEPLCEPL